jgi:hypothetical protein
MSPLPKTCFRGLRRSDWVKDGGVVSLDAFMPDESTEAARATRAATPAGRETSINWEDDPEGALAATRRDKSNAAHGVARCYVSLALDQMEAIDGVRAITMERDPKTDNRYHGNLVFPPGRPKSEYRALAGRIATAARPVEGATSPESESQTPGETA